MADTSTNNKIVNYASLNKFRELVTAAYNQAIADEFVAKVGELKDADGNSYTVAQVVGTPITVETTDGNTVVVSLKDIISAEATRAKAVESDLSTRVSSAETNISDLQSTVNTLTGGTSGSISESIEDAITIKTVKVDGTVLTPDASKAINITGIKANADAIAVLNGDSTIVGSVDKKVADAKAELTTEINKKADKATTIAGYGITDTYTKTEIDTKLETKQDTIDDLDTIRSNATTGAGLATQVNTNKTNIANLQSTVNILNGASTVEGSVDKKVADAIANVVANAPADFDTLKEIADYIASDKTNAASMNNAISINTAAIEKINGDEATTGSVAKAIADAKSELNTTISGVSNRVTVVENWKTSLGAIEANAQVNVIETVKVDNAALTVTDKAVNIDLSGKADVSTLNTVESNLTTEINKKANSADVYAKTETYTQAEIDAKVAAVSNQLVFASDEDITAMFA